MGIGASLFLIAIGAILLWAVSATVAGVSINTIGVILIVVGAVGLLVGLLASQRADRRDTVGAP
jgi:ABC-type antimicrobial peptide transport system permease subunit